MGMAHLGIQVLGLNSLVPTNQLWKLDWPELREREGLADLERGKVDGARAGALGKEATALVVLPSNQGFGSAFCVDRRGLFATNAHVVGKDRAVPWTQPDENIMDPENPLDCLGEVRSRHIASVTVSAQPLLLPRDIEPANFLALATPNGGEVIDADTYRRQQSDSIWNWIPTTIRTLTAGR